MFKNDKAPKTVKTLFSITPLHKQMIERFMTEKGLLSQSDVVRQAINFFHDKSFPDYVFRETAAGQKKAKTIKEEEAFAAVTDTEYATDVVKGLLLPNTESIMYVIIFGYYNTLVAYPVEGIKETIQKEPGILEQQLKEVQARTVIEGLTVRAIQQLKSEYDIIVPDEYQKE